MTPTADSLFVHRDFVRLRYARLAGTAANPMPPPSRGREATRACTRYARAVDIEVLHADDTLVVVDKPAGLLAVPGRGPDKQDCAASRAQRLWPDALVVHRLDMATSGLLVFARGAPAQRLLSTAFADRAVAKTYVALVHGEPPAEAGEVALPLRADWPNRPRQTADASGGKPALTRWRVLKREGSRTRLELEPVTGRTHQLRVHLQAIGHPMVGDRLYGIEDDASRLMLHAWRLALRHPGTGAAVSFAAPMPF